MTFLDLKNDFYRPLWIRVLLLVIMFAWALIELSSGAVFWGIVFGGVGAVALWQWFFDGWPDTDGEQSNGAAITKSTAENGDDDGAGHSKPK